MPRPKGTETQTMTFIYWNDDYMFITHRDHSKQGGRPGKGIIIAPTSPFKGVCNRCSSLKIVRHYPYSAADNSFGVFCERCMKQIDEDLKRNVD